MPHTIRRYGEYSNLQMSLGFFAGISPSEIHFSIHTNDIPGYYSNPKRWLHSNQSFSVQFLLENFHSDVHRQLPPTFFRRVQPKYLPILNWKMHIFCSSIHFYGEHRGNENTVIIQCFVGNWCGTEDNSLNIDDVDYYYIHSFSTHFNIRATKTYLFWRMKWISLKIEKKCRIDNNNGSSCSLHFYSQFIEWIHNSKKSTCAFNP